MSRHLIIIAAIAVLPLLAALPREGMAGVFSEDGRRVDLSGCLTFEQYAASGSAEEAEALSKRLEGYKTADFLEDEVKGIKGPVILLTIGMMYCPDCKVSVPFTEAIARLSPGVETR
ncbi:MAG: thioredoxin family protein, partial [Synergistaceae bacterium]|nr:thioredoxin family protein [Synergistaceae bacterium]